MPLVYRSLVKGDQFGIVTVGGHRLINALQLCFETLFQFKRLTLSERIHNGDLIKGAKNIAVKTDGGFQRTITLGTAGQYQQSAQQYA